MEYNVATGVGDKWQVPLGSEINGKFCSVFKGVNVK